MEFEVSIEKKKCVLCGACVAQCPEHFELDKEAAIVLTQKMPKEVAKKSEIICPTNAIIIKEAK
ncbi:MAG: ferredoxin [Candidatus Woesearchaeota archaeon]